MSRFMQVLGQGLRASNRAFGSTIIRSESTTSSKDFVDVPTHTKQTFSEGDYRLARFENQSMREKEVNTRFAIDLIEEAPPIPVKDRYTFCEGGNGPLGHPRVFINLDQPGNHSCGYCGLRFYQEHGTEGHHH